MNTGNIITIVISVIILVGVFAIGIGINKKLIGEGKIAKRNIDFADYASEFTSRVGSAEAVTEAVRSLDYKMIGADMRGSSARQSFRFSGSSYEAVLNCTAFDEASGIAVYEFRFTRFKMNRGVPQSALSMNKLLTQIEKMFLSFDPNTGVKNYKLDFRTKHSLL